MFYQCIQGPPWRLLSKWTRGLTATGGASSQIHGMGKHFIYWFGYPNAELRGFVSHIEKNAS